VSAEIPPAYDPKQVESKWYQHWLDQCIMGVEIDREAEPFCIVIPPPNVTGVLHMGHALDNTIQDLLIRWRRMQGRPTLWLPGTDHAGIATQNVVEQMLAEEGLTRHDDYIDAEFGTGALKVTPGHDPNDLEIGERHGLPSVVVIGEDGTMTEEAGAYAGLDRFEARERVLADLEKRGLLECVEDYQHVVGHCERCDTILEPLVSTQWFVKMKPLAGEGLEAVDSGAVRFVPERWTKVYRDWLQNVEDWCISRQLWWGHQLPAWYCAKCDDWIVAREDPTECPKCGSRDLQQSPDVLDTWFSSALWPFSTLGWPDQTEDLQYFYPTSALVTAYDIIFFWVARMIMMGVHLLGEKPFEEVFIHGLVRTPEGKKMSKSLGTGLDPLELIDQYGADALRFALTQMITHGQDLRYSEDRLVGARNFCNKLWNVTRFVVMNLDGSPEAVELGAVELTLADRWILSRRWRSTLSPMRRGLTRTRRRRWRPCRRWSPPSAACGHT